MSAKLVQTSESSAKRARCEQSQRKASEAIAEASAKHCSATARQGAA
ncbi:hypothetical protein U9M73_09085 [Paenibacillus phoenicis]|uniref:Uncharacterized protein n=1 Tax=Paenibacillus phoenicis TaxID=554117 RepID=A0ABU5PKF1_9BACL|nr:MULTISPECIES: hypothetical protein [Paenibacillus]MEA3570157.1 hypothetical protein [Paenibacillus phoenicis]